MTLMMLLIRHATNSSIVLHRVCLNFVSAFFPLPQADDLGIEAEKSGISAKESIAFAIMQNANSADLFAPNTAEIENRTSSNRHSQITPLGFLNRTENKQNSKHQIFEQLIRKLCNESGRAWNFFAGFTQNEN